MSAGRCDTARKVRPAGRLHRQRRAMQLGSILTAILIPATGLLRIDPIAGAIVILNRQIWFSDFFVMTGFWLMLAIGAIMLYSTMGTVFCGWACPQNSVSEWANYLTHKLLGKRADVMSLEGKGQVAAAKNKAVNWLALGLSFLLVSCFFAIIPLFYFYPPEVVWSFIIFRPDPHLARSLHYIYAVCVLIILLDVAVIRHFWCRYACIYRMWQHLFKTRQTLHISYDGSRSADCAKCNFCQTSCIIDIDPKKTNIFDSCINCGECIDACDRLHAKSGENGLLSFEFGERRESKENSFRHNVGTLRGRMIWIAPVFIAAAAMFGWGLYSYNPYHIAVYRSEHSIGTTVNDYRIQVSNKLYRPAEISLTVKGLPAGSYQLDSGKLKLGPAMRQNIDLHIEAVLPKGLHPVTVEARSVDGWTGSFRFEHFSARD